MSIRTRQERGAEIRIYAAQKEGLTAKLHLDMDMHSLPVMAILTEGTAADCMQSAWSMAAQPRICRLRGYDAHGIVEYATHQGMTMVISSVKKKDCSSV